ncbi:MULTISPECIES: hypothetical protein [unclassified Sinorhizobium]|uniref:hypothetical protein n=1 Tax=unclassified Sinorhizobium TaxID=2613772 RepID=UPI0024C3CA45|nr:MULTISPECIES: hypothetical protein [unclassified Sinorhizobium]MDK1373380.1 hypothetical protein [Sinorhizobium sp. 6-70]MDK1481149.1 hypothetical protein [Sinorhizobium sp. 6-117]
MLKFIATTFLAAASAVSAFAAGQSGEPRYLIKAWIQKYDKSFVHATGWCGTGYLCTLKVGEYDIRIRFFLSGESYRLSVRAAPDDPAACCVFANRSEEVFVSGGSPHAEKLYFELPDALADKGRVEFGTLFIALEDLL